jgi:type VI secretion system secreted protein VgrG
MTAQGDLTTAYTAAATLSPTQTLTTIAGATTLNPGIYLISSTADLTGALTLKGGSGALFVFQSSAFTTGSGADNLSVVFFNTDTSKYGYDPNIFWETGSSMTLGTYTALEGNILAYASITLDPYSKITCGSALAETGAVTLSGYNTISGCGGGGTTVPEPGTLSLLGSGLAILAGVARRRMRI